MIKSLHIIGSRGSGGAERFYCRLTAALNEAGQPAVAIHPPGSGVAAELPAHVPQRQVPMRGVWDLLARWRLQRLIRGEQPDIVQTYMGRATRLVDLPRDRRPVHLARLGGYYNLKGYRHAHAWVGNTRGICDYLLAAGLPAERVFHIGNFVDIAPPPPRAAVAQIRRRYDILDDAIVVLSAGRLHVNKGYDVLLKAFASLPAEIQGHRVFLVIVGDGPLRDELAELAQALEIGERVRWPGWQQDLAPYHAMATLFVSPSRHEPLGNVILEAWAHGVPLVATKTAGAAELIEDGIDGLIAETESVESLAATIHQALIAPAADRASLTAAGTRKLRTSYGRKAIIDAYADMYRRLLKA